MKVSTGRNIALLIVAGLFIVGSFIEDGKSPQTIAPKTEPKYYKPGFHLLYAGDKNRIIPKTVELVVKPSIAPDLFEVSFWVKINAKDEVNGLYNMDGLFYLKKQADGHLKSWLPTGEIARKNDLYQAIRISTGDVTGKDKTKNNKIFFTRMSGYDFRLYWSTEREELDGCYNTVPFGLKPTEGTLEKDRCSDLTENFVLGLFNAVRPQIVRFANEHIKNTH